MGTKRVAFLRFIELMVFETNEKHPLSKHQILRKLEDAGYYVNDWIFDEFVKDSTAAGLEIKRRAEPGVERSANRYWYDGGWI